MGKETNYAKKLPMQILTLLLLFGFDGCCQVQTEHQQIESIRNKTDLSHLSTLEFKGTKD